MYHICVMVGETRSTIHMFATEKSQNGLPQLISLCCALFSLFLSLFPSLSRLFLGLCSPLKIREFSFHSVNANKVWPFNVTFGEWLLDHKDLLKVTITSLSLLVSLFLPLSVSLSPSPPSLCLCVCVCVCVRACLCWITKICVCACIDAGQSDFRVRPWNYKYISQSLCLCLCLRLSPYLFLSLSRLFLCGCLFLSHRASAFLS